MSTQWNAGSGFEQAPLGAHDAICIGIIDLGTQEGEWKGEKLIRRQNIITWELADEEREDGKPFTISKFYTTSLGEKSNLYKDLTSWLGKAPAAPFDPRELIGKGCQVIITEKNDKHVVNAVVQLSKNKKLSKPTNDTTFFSLEAEDFDEDVFDGIPDGLKKIIMKSPEYAERLGGGTTADEEDEDFDPAF